jgi:hypothetical protein
VRNGLFGGLAAERVGHDILESATTV